MVVLAFEVNMLNPFAKDLYISSSAAASARKRYACRVRIRLKLAANIS